jgi:hypothetical protein
MIERGSTRLGRGTTPQVVFCREVHFYLLQRRSRFETPGAGIVTLPAQPT